MIIEEGKFYRTSDGEKIGPMEFDQGGQSYARQQFDGRLWLVSSGKRFLNRGPDLIAEWTDEPKSPIVTKTVKSLEAGVYNNVALVLNEHCGWQYCLPLNNYTKEELRAAAKTLLEIADFLEEEDK